MPFFYTGLGRLNARSRKRQRNQFPGSAGYWPKPRGTPRTPLPISADTRPWPAKRAEAKRTQRGAKPGGTLPSSLSSRPHPRRSPPPPPKKGLPHPPPPIWIWIWRGCRSRLTRASRCETWSATSAGSTCGKLSSPISKSPMSPTPTASY